MGLANLVTEKSVMTDITTSIKTRGKTIMAKLVSNLLSDISKARDLIERGNIKEINNKMVIFDRISRAVKTQLSLYVNNPAHELDFTPEDLNELSTEVFEYRQPLIISSSKAPKAVLLIICEHPFAVALGIL